MITRLRRLTFEWFARLHQLFPHFTPSYLHYICIYEQEEYFFYSILCLQILRICKMQYAPFASDIELPFYTALASHKINHDKLDDSARPVLGLYEIRSTDSDNASCRIQIHGNSLACQE